MSETKMTIYYRKSNGLIAGMCGCINDMSWYGQLKDDYCLTHDFIVIDLDEYVMNNLKLFKVEDGKLKLKDTTNLSKYI